MAPPAEDTLKVTKQADTNDGKCNSDCSLREAVVAANADPDRDTIRVPAGTYKLTSPEGDLDIETEVTIEAVRGTAVIDGQNTDRVLEITASGEGLPQRSQDRRWAGPERAGWRHPQRGFRLHHAQHHHQQRREHQRRRHREQRRHAGAAVHDGQRQLRRRTAAGSTTRAAGWRSRPAAVEELRVVQRRRPLQRHRRVALPEQHGERQPEQLLRRRDLPDQPGVGVDRELDDHRQLLRCRQQQSRRRRRACSSAAVRVPAAC